jgi:hypothetical protein
MGIEVLSDLQTSLKERLGRYSKINLGENPDPLTQQKMMAIALSGDASNLGLTSKLTSLGLIVNVSTSSKIFQTSPHQLFGVNLGAKPKYLIPQIATLMTLAEGYKSFNHAPFRIAFTYSNQIKNQRDEITPSLNSYGFFLTGPVEGLDVDLAIQENHSELIELTIKAIRSAQIKHLPRDERFLKLEIEARIKEASDDATIYTEGGIPSINIPLLNGDETDIMEKVHLMERCYLTCLKILTDLS